ncbi:MAG: M14 family zinc carboxypeptidase [Phycisphaerales bacterium]|jgi:murein tripeptide amidase MpaA|nr:M14 family zinc carboxypeptidase [Phycisphaerales bacterium]
MPRTLRPLSAALLVAFSGLSALAQEADLSGHSAVTVMVQNRDQLDMVLSLAEGIWSERVGVGPIDIQVSPEARAKLDALGITYRVMVDDLGTFTRQRFDEIELLNRRRDTAWFQNYRTLAEIRSYLGQLEADHPDFVDHGSVGDSLQGEDINLYTITAPGDRTGRVGVLLMGCQHAREWLSPMTVTYIADQLVTQYGTDTRITDLMDAAVFYIIPVSNPDGYLYTWSNTNNRYWRKNRRPNFDGTFGVDLNRNWSVAWGGTGSSGTPNSETYRGTAAFSEPETQRIRDFALAHPDIAAHIDFHTYSQLVLWPWGYTVTNLPEPDNSRYTALGIAMANEILAAPGVAYTPEQSSDLYEAAGDSSDWFHGVHGSTSFTIEMRPASGGLDGFSPAATQILPTARENLPAALRLAEHVAFPLSWEFPNGVPDSADADAAATIDVRIVAGSGQLNPASATVSYRTGPGSFTTTPMTSLGSGLYRATLPAQACGETTEYYFTAETTDLRVVHSPAQGEGNPRSLGFTQSIVSAIDDVETPTGWIIGAPGDNAVRGVWERANPEATAAQPEDDHSNPGTLCYVTGPLAGTALGANDVDGGVTTLVSPPFDALAQAGDAVLEYWYWFSNDKGASPGTDAWQVAISGDNGSTWTVVEQTLASTNAWVHREVRIADHITPTSQVRLRFVARDDEPGGIVEAAVDDLAMLFLGCTDTGCDADWDGSGGQPDSGDFLAYLNDWAGQNPVADLAPAGGDGNFDSADFLAYLNLFAQGC